MPLLDHFRPPLSRSLPWEGFHNTWTTEISRHLNRQVLPPHYLAIPQLHVGGRVEVDVATFDERPSEAEERTSGNGGVAVAAWAPPRTALAMPAIFPDELEVHVFATEGGLTLVGAVEMVSPANKDRPATRQAFAIKCANYLQQGIGLVIVDVVSERLANLHDELIELLAQSESFRFPGGGPLYAVSYRPVRREPGGDQIEIWPNALSLGEALPRVPLALRGGPTLPLDLETTYMEARASLRL
jgi:hypothetical protein